MWAFHMQLILLVWRRYQDMKLKLMTRRTGWKDLRSIFASFINLFCFFHIVCFSCYVTEEIKSNACVNSIKNEVFLYRINSTFPLPPSSSSPLYANHSLWCQKMPVFIVCDEKECLSLFFTLKKGGNLCFLICSFSQTVFCNHGMQVKTVAVSCVNMKLVLHVKL